MRHVSRLTSLATVMHADRYQEVPASSGYKSQRRNRMEGEGEDREDTTEKRKKTKKERGET
jgi:hypothetical protein